MASKIVIQLQLRIIHRNLGAKFDTSNFDGYRDQRVHTNAQKAYIATATWLLLLAMSVHIAIVI